MSNTIISVQYAPNELLTFKVYEASYGSIVHQTNKSTTLKCQIRKTTYMLSSEHLIQMSNRELHELLAQLKIDGNQFL